MQSAHLDTSINVQSQQNPKTPSKDCSVHFLFNEKHIDCLECSSCRPITSFEDHGCLKDHLMSKLTNQLHIFPLPLQNVHTPEFHWLEHQIDAAPETQHTEIAHFVFSGHTGLISGLTPQTRVPFHLYRQEWIITLAKDTRNGSGPGVRGGSDWIGGKIPPECGKQEPRTAFRLGSNKKPCASCWAFLVAWVKA